MARTHWDGKIALKGILDADDAREAINRGVDAIIVSNHGGRQLDDVPSTIHALPAIVEGVDGRIEVLMDGGIRSGLDVVKALSLGARACLIGRPWVYAVAARGEKGVDHILRIIREEIRVTLGLTGFTNVQDLNRSALVETVPISLASSPFAIAMVRTSARTWTQTRSSPKASRCRAMKWAATLRAGCISSALIVDAARRHAASSGLFGTAAR